MVTLGAGLLTGLCATMLTGCADDDDWPYGPPNGWGSNYFYDSRLVGQWELEYYNGNEVSSYDTNYMDFYGKGHGRYYYYSNGRLLSEDMAYFCQERGPGSDLYQINVQYENGQASTMNYALSNGGDSLTLQWRSGGVYNTYIYSRVYSVPY